MANDPQVAVRFAVKDAEVVRQALQNLGKDGEAALKKLDAAGKPVPKALTAVSDVVNEMKGARGLYRRARPRWYGAARPWSVGLAVGAALGIAYFAMTKATDAANKLAEGGAAAQVVRQRHGPDA